MSVLPLKRSIRVYRSLLIRTHRESDAVGRAIEVSLQARIQSSIP